MKKLLGILIVGLLWSNVGKTESSDKVGMTHELGLQITGYYSYDEPDFMYNRSRLENNLFDNFGLVYNFKNSFLVNEFLTEFELDTDFRRIKFDYWSNSTGTRSNMDNDVFNLRALYGFKLTDKLILWLCEIDKNVEFIGAPYKIRTCDPRFRKPMLCQKSFENEHSSLNNSTKWLKLLSHCVI